MPCPVRVNYIASVFFHSFLSYSPQQIQDSHLTYLESKLCCMTQHIHMLSLLSPNQTLAINELNPDHVFPNSHYSVILVVTASVGQSWQKNIYLSS